MNHFSHCSCKALFEFGRIFRPGIHGLPFCIDTEYDGEPIRNRAAVRRAPRQRPLHGAALRLDQVDHLLWIKCPFALSRLVHQGGEIGRERRLQRAQKRYQDDSSLDHA